MGYNLMLAKVYAFTDRTMPANRYHNFRHSEDVLQTVRNLCDLEGIGDENRFLLETSALLHDIVYVIGKTDNEEKSSELAGKLLPMLGYSSKQTDIVKALILATKFPTSPNSYLEQVLCDADVDNFGREDFFERGEEIREEIGVENNLKWRKIQKSLLENHKFYTQSSKTLREEGVKKNIEKLNEIIEKN